MPDEAYPALVEGATVAVNATDCPSDAGSGETLTDRLVEIIDPVRLMRLDVLNAELVSPA